MWVHLLTPFEKERVGREGKRDVELTRGCFAFLRSFELQLLSDGETGSGGPFKNEFNVTVKFDEDQKIISVEEWVVSCFAFS